MSFERYETYRQCMLALHQRAVPWAMGQGKILNKAGQKLRMLAADGTIIFEDEEDVPYLSDAMLYETTIDGIRTISAYFKKYPPSNVLETQFREAMGIAKFGLYRAISTNPHNAETHLHGLVADIPDITLINLGMSETATPGLVVATRIISIAGMSISTGAFFPFESAKEKRLVREWWSKQGLERYAHLHKLFRRSSSILFLSV